MKKLVVIWIWMGLSNYLLAQSVPMFETTIRVKDSLGHQDSVVIGYDLDDIIFDTTKFHEVIDNSPFDSVFDVRIVQLKWEMVYLYPPETGDMYKRLITAAETAINNPWCTLGGSSILLIHAKYQPVTLYWDRNAFDPTYCRDNAFFTPDKRALISDPPNAWIDSGGPIIYACASKEDSFTYRLTRQASWDGNLNHPPFWPIHCMKEIEGIGVDSIIGIALDFVFGSFFSPCHLITDANSLALQIKQGFQVHPNPSEGIFKLYNERMESIQSIRMFDAYGCLALELPISPGLQPEFMECQASRLTPGIYYLTVHWQDGYEAVRKVVKI